MIIPSNLSALVLVDLMERIVQMNLEPHSGAAVIDVAADLASRFRDRGAAVVHVRTERPNVATQPPGSELMECLVQSEDVIVTKRTFGAFHNTGLHDELQRRGVTILVFGGIATNIGVESTARSAADHDYELVFVVDAMTALTRAEHETAVQCSFPRFGDVVASSEIALR